MKNLILKIVAILGILIFQNAQAIPTNLQWPIKSSPYVKDTSLFFNAQDAVEGTTNGNRPCASGTAFYRHLGIDIKATSNPKTFVYPVMAGVVAYKGGLWGALWGDIVVIKHENNTWTSLYGHLKNIPSNLIEGTPVNKDTILGEITYLNPNTTGDVDHLHLGIRKGKYEATSRWGFGDCNSTKKDGTPNTYGFVNPLDYLSNSSYGKTYYSLVDDASASYEGEWKNSTSISFYHGEGYKALDTSRYGNARYSIQVTSTGNFTVWARSTKDTNRVTDAKFTINIDSPVYSFVKTTNPLYVNQVTNGFAKGSGAWYKIGDITIGTPNYPQSLSSSISVTIEPSYRDKPTSTLKYLISDAILVERVNGVK